jgi:hypothetical protein
MWSPRVHPSWPQEYLDEVGIGGGRKAPRLELRLPGKIHGLPLIGRPPNFPSLSHISLTHLSILTTHHTQRRLMSANGQSNNTHRVLTDAELLATMLR